MHMESRLNILLMVSTFLTAFFIACTAYSEEFGLVERKGENIYLHSSAPFLKPNSPVQLLKPGVILHIQKRVEKKLKHASHIMIRSKPGTVYLLQAEKELGPTYEPTGAVILPAGENKKLHTNYRYFNCTSNEGVHHSIYSVNKGEEERLWSAYQYLPYEVEPSCSESQYAE